MGNYLVKYGWQHLATHDPVFVTKDGAETNLDLRLPEPQKVGRDGARRGRG